MDSFIAIFLISLIVSISGNLSVFRKASFLIASVSHSALAGVAFSLFLSSQGISVDYFVVAAAFAIAFSAMATVFSKFHDVDTGVSISFALSMALAVAFLSLTRNLSGKIWSFLFGELYLITDKDLFYLILTAVMVLLLFGIFYEKLLFYLFDPEGSEASGINVKFLDFILILIISLSAVSVIRSVGAILAYAIFVAPAAIGKKFAKSVKQSFIFSSLISFSCLYAGLLLSSSIPISASALSALIASALYFALMIKKS